MEATQRSLALAKSDQVYARCDHSIWRFAVYDGLHGGRELANICGVYGLEAIGALIPATASRVLDVGCGAGDACLYIAEKFGCTVVGADINQGQISRARRKLQAWDDAASGRVAFVCGDIAAQQPAAFDLGYSLDTLTLVSDLPGTLKSVRLALRRGAAFFWADLFAGPNLDDATREFAWDQDGMINLTDRSSARDLLQQCGFADDRWLDQTDMAAQAFSVICERLEQFVCLEGRMEEDLLQEWKHASRFYRDAFRARRLEYLWCTALANP